MATYQRIKAAEVRRYLNISLGSLSELSYTLFLARDLGILSTLLTKAAADC